MSDTKVERQVQMPPATDLYNINHLLSEEERLVRDTVRKFVRERVLPISDLAHSSETRSRSSG